MVRHHQNREDAMRLAVKLALGLAAVVGSAQAAEPTQPIVLKAAYLFDSKSGNLTNGGAVLVEGDKIKALGSQAAPANAKVIDLGDATRSEEHTSELQSQSNLVCRLLLEKKK